MLEIQALLEVLSDTRIWELPFMTNPFPYLSTDFNTMDDDS